MFTGIIQHVGRVVAAAAAPDGRRLRIDVGPLASRLAPGASVTIDGACQTVAALCDGAAEFDAVPETLGRTTLGQLGPGDRVNLEPAVAVGEVLDGHIVQGHVDGVGEVVGVDRGGPGGYLLQVAAAPELTDQMVAKGSVAVAGVSLTLVDVAGGRFSVALVPTTLERTTLGSLRPGGRVNLETDVLGKYVRRCLADLLAGGEGGVTLAKLRRAGFV